jgi:glucose/arabinose dehydrogenase
MLRVDADVVNPPFGVPPDNPDPNGVGTLPFVWAKGLRNPWRFSFDRATGDLYIGDVGQNAWEEVDFQPASSSGGENYGWRLLEGSSCFNPPMNCDPGAITTLPVHEYNQTLPGRAIIGGFVYRGSDIPGLQGTYFYSDNQASSFVRTFEVIAGVAQNHKNRTADIEDQGETLDFPTSFGEDSRGELYIAKGNGDILKLVPGN